MVFSSLRWKTAFVTVIFSAFVTAAHADLVTNGSFETPTVPAGSFTNFNTGSTLITGWTVVGPQVSVVSGTFTQLGFNFPAGNGSQWLDLTGDGSNNDTEGVQQTIATTSGTTYDLSFLVGNVVGSPFGTSSTVDVLVNGTPFQTATNSGGGTTLTWAPFSKTFTATSSSTVLEFLNGDPAGDNSNGLDSVSVVPVAAVPEVSPAPVLAGCLIGLFAVVYRRKSARKKLS